MCRIHHELSNLLVFIISVSALVWTVPSKPLASSGDLMKCRLTSSVRVKSCLSSFNVLQLRGRKENLCYRANSSLVTWNQARFKCSQRGAKVLYFKDRQELQTFRELNIRWSTLNDNSTVNAQPKENLFWIGVGTKKGRLVWSRNNREIGPDDFHSLKTYPTAFELQKELCAYASFDVSSWGLVSCSETLRFACRARSLKQPAKPRVLYRTGNDRTTIRELIEGDDLHMTCSAYEGWGKLSFLLRTKSGLTVPVGKHYLNLTTRQGSFRRSGYCLPRTYLDFVLKLTMDFNDTTVLCTSEYDLNRKTYCLDKEPTCSVLGTLVIHPRPVEPHWSPYIPTQKTSIIAAGAAFGLLLFFVALMKLLRRRYKPMTAEGECFRNSGAVIHTGESDENRTSLAQFSGQESKKDTPVAVTGQAKQTDVTIKPKSTDAGAKPQMLHGLDIKPKRIDTMATSQKLDSSSKSQKMEAVNNVSKSGTVAATKGVHHEGSSMASGSLRTNLTASTQKSGQTDRSVRSVVASTKSDGAQTQKKRAKQ